MDTNVEVIEKIVPEGSNSEDVNEVSKLKYDIGNLGRITTNKYHDQYSNARVDELIVPFCFALWINAQMKPLK